MRKLTAATLLAALAALAGCEASGPPIDWGSSPGYSSADRGRKIWRNWGYEGAQMVDDIDRALLLRPASQMTPWHVR